MPTYVDVAAVRIQGYLARSPDLAGVRAASELLAAATGPAALDGYLAAAAMDGLIGRRNTAAGDADGVISVVAEEDTKPEALAEHLLAALRAALPAVELEAAWGAGDDYTTARTEAIDPMRSRYEGKASLPATAEWPLGGRCTQCGASIADRLEPKRRTEPGSNTYPSATSTEPPQRRCADCAGRDGERGGRSAEARLLESLGANAPKRPATFTELAEAGTDGKRNHLATIYIDGNSIGRFFDAVVQAGIPNKEALSRALVDATSAALRHATRSILADPPGPVVPVTPHLVGGDDVIASVPASLAWPFTIAYLEHFGAAVARACADHAPALADQAPTASAGMVIAHFKYPFASSLALAGTLLRQAKSRTSGRAASVAWTDVTRWGEGPPKALGPWTTAEVAARRPLVRALAVLPPSSRMTLAGIVGNPDRHDTEVENEITRQVSRLGHQEVLPHLAPFAGVATWRSAIDVARWWAA